MCRSKSYRRRLSLNPATIESQNYDASITKLDTNCSINTLNRTRGLIDDGINIHKRNAVSRDKMRNGSLKARYRPSVRDMTITDNAKLNFFGIPEYKTPKFIMNIKGGRLNKTKKVSCTEEIMEKSKESPGIGKYKWNKPFEIRGHSRQRSRKIGFIDEVYAMSKEIPGHKYKIDYNKFKDRAPNYSFRKIRKPKEKIAGSFIRDENGVLVNTKVGPAGYKCEDAFLKTQVICKNKLIFNKNKEKRYFDQLLDNKKFVPGVGLYKNLEKAYRHTTRPSTAKVKSVGGR